MNNPSTIRLLVAETRPLHRAALSAAFDAEEDMTVITQVSDTTAVVERAQRLEPDVVCIGSGERAHDWLRVCEQIRAQSGSLRILVIDDVPHPRMLLAAIRAGADGYATKDLPLSALVAAVRQVYAGQTVVPPAMLGRLLRDLTAHRRQDDKAFEMFLRLTAREKQVLELLTEGCGNTEIADILVISPQTARTHIQNVVRKLGTHSRLEAAATAVKHGWFD